MPGKDFGIYREATGGTSVGTTAVTIPLDTTETEDSAFTIAAGRDEVTIEEDGLVLFYHNGEYSGTGAKTFRQILQRHDGVGWTNLNGGFGYGHFTGVDGVDQDTVFVPGVFEFSNGDKIRVRARNEAASGTVTEAAARTALQLVKLPSAFDACILTRTGDVTNISSTWTSLSWTSQTKIDTATFTHSTVTNPQNVTCKTAGRYLLASTVTYRGDGNGAEDFEGAQIQLRVMVNGALVDHSNQRRTIPGGSANESFMTVHHLMYLDLAADDVVRFERRAINKVDSLDEVDIDGDRCQLALVKIDDAADVIWLRHASDADPDPGPVSLPFDTEIEKDADWTHSTVTNNEEVTSPTAKIIMGTHVSFGRGGTPGTQDIAWDVYYRLAAGTRLSRGSGASGPNLGDVSGSDLSNTDAVLGFMGEASGQVLEVRVDLIGTGADSASTCSGYGLKGIAYVWWALNVDDWPEDTTTVLPSPVTAPAVVPAPTVDLGALTVSPGAVAAPAVVPAPTLDHQLNVSAGPVATSAAVPGPAVDLGPITVSPGAVASSGAVPAPTLDHQLTVAASPVAAAVGVPEPTVGLVLVVAPGAVAIPAAVPAATVVQDSGPQTIQPGPVVATLAVPSPSIGLGLITIAPAPASVAAGVPEPTLNLILGVAAAPVVVPSSVPSATISLGALSVAPAPVAATLAVPAPALVIPGAFGFYERVSYAARSRFISVVEPLLGGAPIQYDNLPFSKPDTAAWGRVSVVFQDGEAVDAGGEVTIEARGELRATLYTPIHGGTKAARLAADIVVSSFRGVHVTDAKFGTPRVGGPPVQDSFWWRIEVVCPFRAYDTNEVPAATAPDAALGIEKVSDLIRTRWKAEVEDIHPLPTQYDALPFTRPDWGAWARLTILAGSAFQVERGETTYRTPGVVVAQVLTRSEMGEKEALQIVDAVNVAFRHRNVQGLQFGAPRVSPSRRVGDEFQMTIQIPFQGDE